MLDAKAAHTAKTALAQAVNGDHTLADDPRRLGGLLADFGVERGKIYLITLAQKAGVVSDLRRQKDLPASLTHPRLYSLLEDDYAVSSKGAAWVVETWAEVLGLPTLPLPQSLRQAQPIPQPPQPPRVRPGGPLASQVTSGTSFTVTKTPVNIKVTVDDSATPESVKADLAASPGLLAGLPVAIEGQNTAAIAALVYHGKAQMRSVTVNDKEL